MTVRDIFELRRQGRVEEAYEAIKARYKVYRGHYTTLCMFWTARDIFNKRLNEGRVEEAEKIYKALQRVLPNIDDSDGKATAFMQYAERRLKELSTFNFQLSTAPSTSGRSQGEELSTFNFQLSTAQDRLQRLLEVVKGEMSVREMMAALGFGSRDKFLKNYLSPAIKAGLVEMTHPNSPKSPKQKYRRSQGDK